MDFKLGDLVHIPSGSYRVLYTMDMEFEDEIDEKQIHIPFSFSITQEPKLGVFKKYFGEQECIVMFNDGEFCISTRCLYKKQGEVAC